MKTEEFLNLGAFQGPIVDGNVNANLQTTIKAMRVADERSIDILCMPESFLQGYFSTKELAYKYSISLDSPEFLDICQQFAEFKRTTLLLGLNEREDDKLFNTVVVIENGRCIGRYRKAYTYAPYDYFDTGREFPIFEKKGVKYGIIICVDSTYIEPALITSLRGARVLFCPMFNRVHEDARMLLYLQRKSHFITRAFDNQCWIVASDIVWDTQHETCPGYACIINDKGEIMAKSEPFQENILSYSVPIKYLKESRQHALIGSKELFELLKSSYDDNH